MSRHAANPLRDSDTIAVIVHPDNPLRELTLEQLDALFSAQPKRGAARRARPGRDVPVGGPCARCSADS